MRCPHCAGEIPAGSRFCGICGRSIAASRRTPPGAQPGWGADDARHAAASEEVDSVSLFELPASRAGRRAKLALILVLDAILAGAGVVMIVSYADSRRESRRAASPASPDDVVAPAPARAPTPARAPGPTPAGARPAGRPPGGEAGSPPEPKPAPRQGPDDKAKPKAKPRTGATSASGPRLVGDRLVARVAGR
ncbi:MAG TPA: zinc ribbon domain-containing protein [Kofleriaceae bacterium]|nr:zinc ribbon domain-containing protein [Kofleriaceae bacterium]